MKKKFIQDNIMLALSNPMVLEKPADQRFDFAVSICEKAWSKLSSLGYGDVQERGSSVVARLSEKFQYSDEFEKAWKIYSAKPKGDKQQAFKYWQAIDPNLHAWIYQAIPKYLGSLSGGLNAAHFSTFLSKQYWEGFTMKSESPVVQIASKDQEARSLQRLIDNTKDETTKNMLIEQLGRLK